MMNDVFMRKALEIAQLSGNDIAVGAVIVKDNKILAARHNEKEFLNDVTAHAEILAIREASSVLNNWRLDGCDMYVTLEPCPMCMWAILQSRISNLYFGSYDHIYGGFSTLPQMINNANSKLNIKGGIMETECDLMLQKYFDEMRNK